MTLPPIITTARLLALLNEGQLSPISRSCLHKWIVSDPKWRGCIAHASRRKYWLSTARLRSAGILPPEVEAARAESIPAGGFTYSTGMTA